MIGVELDPHCHLTRRKCAFADIIILFKEYPHIDFAERAEELVTLVLGAVLTLFYLWRRDLVANMIGHFMVDFIANVLPRLF